MSLTQEFPGKQPPGFSDLPTGGNLDIRGKLLAPDAQRFLFAFTFPELLAAFEPVDAEAGRARVASRRMGFGAIGLVLAALLAASADPLVVQYAPDYLHVFGFAAAFLGLAGTLLGIWSLRGSSARNRWLKARLKTEIMRLFHFRYLAEHLPDVLRAVGDPDREAAYVKARAEAFVRLRSQVLLKSDEAYQRVIKDPEHSVFAAVIGRCADDSVIEGEASLALTRAWRDSRIAWQFHYVEGKLKDSTPDGRPTPMRQEIRFSLFGWVCIGAIVLLHLVHFAEPWLHADRVLLQVGIVWTALCALAARAIEAGLAPQREVERYEQYRVNIRVALERVDFAGNFGTVLETARAFESRSLEEMISFIRTHARSHFLL